MNAVTLFSYITQEEQERMKVCFGMREVCYENNETIMEYAYSMKKIGLLLEARCQHSQKSFVRKKLRVLFRSRKYRKSNR